MEGLFDTGLAWILALQEMQSPVVTEFFRAITFMGEEMFYLLFVPFLVWSVSFDKGARVGVAFLLSAYINPLLKAAFVEPRPFQLDPTVQLSEAAGNGMPSGHAQSSVFVWGTLAAQFGRRWLWIVALLFMFLIGLSRVMLGVHFPHQVIAGWFTGAVLLIIYLRLGPQMEEWLAGLQLSAQLVIALCVPAILALLFASNDTVSAMGVLAGFGSGFALTRETVHFSADGRWWQRLSRYVVGLIGLLAIYLGLQAVSPAEGASLFLVFRFIRYGMAGIWISYGAPWLFMRMHLSTGQSAQPGYQM